MSGQTRSISSLSVTQFPTDLVQVLHGPVGNSHEGKTEEHSDCTAQYPDERELGDQQVLPADLLEGSLGPDGLGGVRQAEEVGQLEAVDLMSVAVVGLVPDTVRFWQSLFSQRTEHEKA